MEDTDPELDILCNQAIFSGGTGRATNPITKRSTYSSSYILPSQSFWGNGTDLMRVDS